MNNKIKIKNGIILAFLMLFFSIFMISSVSASWTEGLDNGLVSYYKFDEGSGTIINSASPGLSNGINYNAINTTGLINSSYEFENEVGSYISIENQSRFAKGLGMISVSLWAYQNNIGGEWDYMFSIGKVYDGEHGYGFDIIRQYGLLGFTSIWTENNFITTTNMSENQSMWVHIVVTRISDTEVGFWYNGVNVANGTVDKINISNSIVNFGTDSENSANMWDGKIDEVGIWNRTLTEKEIMTLYNNGLGISYSVSNNNTIAGKLTNFSNTFDDETALEPNGQYIFSTNNSGSWINDSVVNFTSTPQMVFSEKILNSTVGTIVNYMWFFTNNEGFATSTFEYTLTTTSGILYSQSPANNTLPGYATNFSINVTDVYGLSPNGQYIFSTNNSGSWINDSAVNFTETPQITWVEKTLTSISNFFLGWKWFFTNNEGLATSTPEYTLTTTSLITNCEELQNISNDLTLDYILVNDINCSDTVNWNAGAGFIPIGTYGNGFLGNFEGQNYTISDLYINGGDDIGLFGDLVGNISNVNLIDVNITGATYVGGLVGYNEVSGIIENSSSSGNMNGAIQNVGLLVGSNYGTINNSYTSGNVTGPYSTGGIAGYSEGTIENSYSTTNVIGIEYTGGIVGYSGSNYPIENCSSSGNVTGEIYIGGIVGINTWFILNSNATGDIFVLNYTNFYGGITGFDGTIYSGNCGEFNPQEVCELYSGCSWSEEDGCLGNTDFILNSFFTGNFHLLPFLEITDCIELQNMSNLTNGWYKLMNDINCSDTVNWNIIGSSCNDYDETDQSTCEVNIGCTWNGGDNTCNGIYNTYLGGFEPIGPSIEFTGNFEGQGYTINDLYINRPTLANCGLFYYINSAGMISNINLENANMTCGDHSGILAGQSDGNIENCSVSGNIIGTYILGGLLGTNGYAPPGIVNNCFSNANAIGTGDYIGGLIGNNGDAGIISNSYATGDVNGGSWVGGLIGFNLGEINNSYAIGNANASVSTAGGFVGQSDGLINNCYSTGNASSIQEIGGFAGTMDGEIYNSYSSGEIIDLGDNTDVGGFVGLGIGNCYNSFWDIETSGQISSAGGTGKTTEEMKEIITFSDAGWDINTSEFDFNNGYPYLGWQNDSGFTWLILQSNEIEEVCDICNETCSPCGGGCTATDLSYMFAGVTDFDNVVGNITDWNTSCITTMEGMFGASDFNQDISSWDVSSVTNMNAMFYQATSFNQNLGSWNITQVTDMLDMFFEATLSNANYDALLNGWSVLPNLQSNMFFNGGFSKYTINGFNARNNLTDVYSWTINDGGLYDIIPPYFTTIPPNASIFDNESLLVQFVGTDDIIFGYYSINDTTNFVINQSGYLSNITSLTSGNYTLNVTINDSVNNINWTIYNVEVKAQPITYIPNITTCIELQNISLNLSGNYLLMNDINCSDTINWNAGAGFVPIGNETTEFYFTGTLDGRNYKIIDLYINRASTNQGLFGRLSGNVSNTILENVNIISSSQYTGGLAGTLTGIIDNCSISGNIGYSGNRKGGFAGWNAGKIKNSYFNGNVSISGDGLAGGIAGESFGKIDNCSVSGIITGYNFIGGLVGDLNTDFATINNSYTNATVIGNVRVGGIVGQISGGIGIYNSYAIGSVTGTTLTGGIVGEKYRGTCTNSFWDINTTGQTTSACGTGKTTKQMKNVRTYTQTNWSSGLTSAWDFVGNPLDDIQNENIWNMDNNGTINGGYPFFSNIQSIPFYNFSDIIPPIFTIIPANASIFYKNESLGVQFEATDETAFNAYSVNDTNFIINQTGFLSNATALTIGTYEIKITISDIENNLNTTQYKVIVKKPTGGCNVLFNITSPINYPGTFLVYSDCDTAFTVYKNGTIISNNSEQSLAVGTYNFSVQRTDIGNNTYNYDDFFFVVNKNPSPCQVIFNKASPQTYPATFIVLTSCSTAYTLMRDGVSIVNNSEQSLAVGTYNFSVQRTDIGNYSNTYSESSFVIVVAEEEEGNRNEYTPISGGGTTVTTPNIFSALGVENATSNISKYIDLSKFRSIDGKKIISDLREWIRTHQGFYIIIGMLLVGGLIILLNRRK